MSNGPRRHLWGYTLACFVLLGLVGAHRAATRTAVNATAYHARVAAAVSTIPYRFGAWEGEDMPIPPAARALLRPNALLGRSYRNASTGEVIQLVVVQCMDSRDMAGHYPPVCYRAHGWTMVHDDPAEEETTVTVDGVLMSRYLFERQVLFDITRRVIYNALILPDRGPVADMKAVRQAAGSPQIRLRGAAQIQILMDSDIPRDRQEKILDEFLTTISNVFKTIVEFDVPQGS